MAVWKKIERGCDMCVRRVGEVLIVEEGANVCKEGERWKKECVSVEIKR